MDSATHPRRLSPADAALWRATRLRAVAASGMFLRDRPDVLAARSLTAWEELLRRPSYAAFVVERGGAVLGAIYAQASRSRSGVGYVGGSWVEPSFRREGIGWLLGDAAIAWARDRGLERLEAWAAADNPASLAIVQRRGYRQTGVTASWPGDPTRRAVQVAIDLNLTWTGAPHVHAG